MKAGAQATRIHGAQPGLHAVPPFRAAVIAFALIVAFAASYPAAFWLNVSGIRETIPTSATTTRNQPKPANP